MRLELANDEGWDRDAVCRRRARAYGAPGFVTTGPVAQPHRYRHLLA